VKNGYELLFTPHMASIDLWKTSGHYEFYKEGMFDQMEVRECRGERERCADRGRGFA
jgi:threonyl-tRNA synthetase